MYMYFYRRIFLSDVDDSADFFFWFAYVEKKVNSANSVADSANNFWFYRRQR